MPKPDAHLLDPARYRAQYPIAPRFGDLDYNMHVNNSAIVTFMEDARFRFNRQNGFYEDLGESRSMLASLAVEYLAQTFVEDPVIIHSAYERLGRTSHTVIQLATQGDRAVAFSRAVVVTATVAGEPTPQPARFVETAKTLLLQP